MFETKRVMKYRIHLQILYACIHKYIFMGFMSIIPAIITIHQTNLQGDLLIAPLSLIEQQFTHRCYL